MRDGHKVTPPHLLSAPANQTTGQPARKGIYSSLAIPLYGGEHKETSLRLMLDRLFYKRQWPSKGASKRKAVSDSKPFVSHVDWPADRPPFISYAGGWPARKDADAADAVAVEGTGQGEASASEAALAPLELDVFVKSRPARNSLLTSFARMARDTADDVQKATASMKQRGSVKVGDPEWEHEHHLVTSSGRGALFSTDI